MGSNQNIETIKAVYAAFGRGDAQFIVDATTDDVDWGTDTAADDAPWWGPRKGHEGVADFFTDFGGAMEVEEFTPLAFASAGDDVFTIVRFRARSRATGKVASMQLHHYFQFRAGKISYYRGTEDTILTAATVKK